jgi:hypothetical protein
MHRCSRQSYCCLINFAPGGEGADRTAVRIASAPMSRSVLNRALAKRNRPVIGRGQGRQPPEAVAHRAGNACAVAGFRDPMHLKNPV